MITLLGEGVWWCFNTADATEFSPLQYTFDDTTGLSLEVTSCDSTLMKWSMRTGYSAFPATQYGLSECDQTFNFTSVAVTNKVKIISKLFDYQSFTKDSSNPYLYQLTLTTEMSFITDTLA